MGVDNFPTFLDFYLENYLHGTVTSLSTLSKVPKSAFCPGFGSPDFKPKVAATLVIEADKVLVVGKTAANDFLADCYCWTRSIFSNEVRQFSIEVLFLFLTFGIFVVFGKF